MTDHLTAPISGSNQGRRGRPFSLRLTEEERKALNERAAEARRHMPYEYGNGRLHGSVAHFLVWAAMQWKAPEPEAEAAPRRTSTRSTRSAGTTRPRPRRKVKRAAARKASKRGGRK